jgi:hypothetical protein
MNLQNITLAQPIERMAVPRQGWFLGLNRFAIRATGCRSDWLLPLSSTYRLESKQRQ